MTSGKEAPVSYIRLLKAVALVVAIVLVAPSVDAIAHVTGSAESKGESFAGIDVKDLLGKSDAYAIADQLEAAADPDSSAMNEVFLREVGLLPAARDVRTDGTGSVVGYVMDGNADDVLSMLDSRMESNGWTCVSLGNQLGSTYVKDEGQCRWAIATCTQVGEATSIVVRCAYQ